MIGRTVSLWSRENLFQWVSFLLSSHGTVRVLFLHLLLIQKPRTQSHSLPQQCFTPSRGPFARNHLEELAGHTAPLLFWVMFPPKLIVKSFKATKEERQYTLSLHLSLTFCHAILSFSLSRCICLCIRHISETNQGGRNDKCLPLRKSACLYLQNEIFVLNNHIAFVCPTLLPLVHNINT